jgi:hypothetical protein
MKVELITKNVKMTGEAFLAYAEGQIEKAKKEPVEKSRARLSALAITVAAVAKVNFEDTEASMNLPVTSFEGEDGQTDETKDIGGITQESPRGGFAANPEETGRADTNQTPANGGTVAFEKKLEELTKGLVALKTPPAKVEKKADAEWPDDLNSLPRDSEWGRDPAIAG